MLKPDYLKTLPNEILALFENIQAWTIKDISRRGATRTAKYQLLTLLEINSFQTAWDSQLDSFKPLLLSTITKMVYKSYEMGYNANEQLIQSTINLITDDLLNITQSLGYKLPTGEYQTVAKFYQNQLNEATLKTMAGVSTYSEAIRTTIKTMSNHGMNYIDYQTGHIDSVLVAVRRAVFGGIKNMAREQAKANAEMLGTDVFEISFHMGYRPQHDWGGRRYSLSGSHGYPTREQLFFQGSTSDYGCLHDEYPVLPNSPMAYNASTLAKLIKESLTNKEYEGKLYDSWRANKRQRELERAMRRTRLELVGLKEIDKKEYDLYKLRYRNQRQEYLKFSKAMGIQPQMERVYYDQINLS